MTPPEQQSGRKPGWRYSAPDGFEGERRFAAHLGTTVERPRFVVDPEDGLADTCGNSGSAESNHASVANERTQEEVTQESPSLASADVVSQPDWRNLVSAKVSSYKSRRPRPERYPSLQLKFEQSPLPRESRLDPGVSSSSACYSTTDAAVPDLEPRQRELEPPVISEATARVLEFPRSLALPMRWDELAEPIIDRPRIVEAPELLPPPPAMGGILIEPSREPEPQRRPGFDMPLESAALGRRVIAGLVDGLVVSLALAAFAYVFLRVTDARPTWRTMYELVLGLGAGLWPAYQFALVVFSGTTPGLRLCRLRIERFDGTPAPRKLRGWRVLVSLLSGISLAIGYLWCFLDEDQLCWHDRITSTHLAETRKARRESRAN